MGKRIRKYSVNFLSFVSFVVLFAAILPARLFPETVSFAIKPPKDKPKLAQPFKIELEVSYPGGFSIEVDTAGFETESFVITDAKSSGKTAGKGGITEKIILEAIPFDIGVATFPSLTWNLHKTGEPRNSRTAAEQRASGSSSVGRYATRPTGVGGYADDQVISRTKSPSFNIEIEPLFKAGDGQEDIRDVYPPFKFFSWLNLAIILLISAVLAALYLIYRKKQSAALKAAEPVDTRPPDVIALDEIRKLLASNLWQEGKIKDFYISLSDIFRTFIYKSLDINAPLMTTFDMVKEFKHTDININTIIKIRESLELCDLVKFAKFMPGEENRDKDVELIEANIAAIKTHLDSKKASNFPLTNTEIPLHPPLQKGEKRGI
ncbi:MAG: hypothetical protein HY746_00650 [Elusimicrobia bacterium]|nr:hypothetical protein [Elusimicrobiota bacterium]